MPDLKLIALDAEDLAVLSAHLQDAVLRLGDAAFQKRDRRFALVANRFDWESALQASDAARKAKFERRRTGLRFERVLAVQVSGLDPAEHDRVVSLLAIEWHPAGEAPEGYVSLVFSGGGVIRLHVECVEAELQDLGAAWQTRSMPVHAGDDEKS
jgi:hypothetical protein